MKILGIVVILLLAGGWWLSQQYGSEDRPPPTVAEQTKLEVEGGTIVGYQDDRHAAFGWQGVPFAAAPVGDRRWAAPGPVSPWQGTLEALAAGPICPQFSSLLSGADPSGGDGSVTGQEDCLYLNVWTPSSAQLGSAELPVMLWIHGGGNTIGHGGSYDGARLAADENVVVITFNYRLGLFGWFSHEALLNGDPLDDSGNYGTLDVARALTWVHDNAAAFGGNPDNVTLFGESAGGFDTLAMIASPLGKGLFHRAIVQSGGFAVTELREARAFAAEGGHPSSSAEIVSRLLVNQGQAQDEATARAMQEDMSQTELRTLLRSASVSDLFATIDGGGFGMVDLPDNLGDGHVLPNLSNAEIFGNAANHNVVPTLLGTNRDEPSIFMARDPKHVDTFLWIFPRLKDEDHYLRAVKYGALAWKARGVDELAELMTAAGNPNVFAYRFDWDEEPDLLGYDLSTALGAGHGLEIAFVFGTFDGGLGIEYVYGDNPNNERLAKSMMGYWAEFARSGDPGQGQGGDPEWLAWGEQGQRMMILDSPPEGLRMSDETVSAETLLAALDQDPAVASQRERCELYANAFAWTGFDPKVYATLGSEGCGAWELDELRSF